MADTPQEVPQPQDPLDMATELLFKTLTDLPKGMEDFRVQESSRTLLMAAQTTAMIDIARSLRVTNDRLLKLEEELRRARL